MNNSDLQEFSAIWGALGDLYGNKPSQPVVKLTFSLLADYELPEIKHAVQQHGRSSKWMPKPAEIIEIIHGKLPSAEQLMGMAQDKNTLLGVFIRRIVGSWDLDHLPARDVITRIQMRTEAIKRFIARAQVGDFTDDELRMFVGRGMDVSQPLCDGLPGCRPMYLQDLAVRVKPFLGVQQIEQAESDDAPPCEETKKRVREMLAGARIKV